MHPATGKNERMPASPRSQSFLTKEMPICRPFLSVRFEPPPVSFRRKMSSLGKEVVPL